MFESSSRVDLTALDRIDTVAHMPRGSDYRIELTARFTFTIEETISGPSELTQVGLEELINRNWWWLSGSTDVLIESIWELEGFKESPAGDENG